MRVGDIQEVAFRKMRGAGYEVGTTLDVTAFSQDGSKTFSKDENEDLSGTTFLARAKCTRTGADLACPVQTDGRGLAVALDQVSAQAFKIEKSTVVATPVAPPAPPAPTPPVEDDPQDEEPTDEVDSDQE